MNRHSLQPQEYLEEPLSVVMSSCQQVKARLKHVRTYFYVRESQSSLMFFACASCAYAGFFAQILFQESVYASGVCGLDLEDFNVYEL